MRSQGAGGGGGAPISSFAQNSNLTRLELYAIGLLLENITQLLIQPFYGFLGQI